MPVQRIENLPAGTHLFTDANIFVYAFLGHSDRCRDLLGLCATEEVLGVTTLDVVNEVTHRMMLAEALATGVIKRERASEIYRSVFSGSDQRNLLIQQIGIRRQALGNSKNMKGLARVFST